MSQRINHVADAELREQWPSAILNFGNRDCYTPNPSAFATARCFASSVKNVSSRGLGDKYSAVAT